MHHGAWVQRLAFSLAFRSYFHFIIMLMDFPEAKHEACIKHVCVPDGRWPGAEIRGCVQCTKRGRHGDVLVWHRIWDCDDNEGQSVVVYSSPEEPKCPFANASYTRKTAFLRQRKCNTSWHPVWSLTSLRRRPGRSHSNTS